jgi:hypothetical protein
MVLLVGLIALALGAAGGLAVAGKKQAEDYRRGYDEGFAQAKAKVEASGLFSGPTEQFIISGNVKSVGADFIEVETKPTSFGPFDEPGPSLRRITVTPTTEIVLTKEKSAEEIAEDNAAYRAEQERWLEASAVGTATPPPAPPSPFEESKVKLSDVQSGMFVVATAASDIAKAAEFDAVRIELRELREAGFAPAGGPGSPTPGAAPPPPPTRPPPAP